MAVFFLVEVTAAKLNVIAELFERGELVPHVGSVLALEQARTCQDWPGSSSTRKLMRPFA